MIAIGTQGSSHPQIFPGTMRNCVSIAQFRYLNIQPQTILNYRNWPIESVKGHFRYITIHLESEV